MKETLGQQLDIPPIDTQPNSSTSTTMSKAALVTGATGLLGRQLIRAFEYPGRDWTVKGTGLSRADGVSVLRVDLEKQAEVEAALDSVK